MTTGGAAAKNSPAPNWEIMMNRLFLGLRCQAISLTAVGELGRKGLR